MPTSEAPDIWRLFAPDELRTGAFRWHPRTLLALLDSPSTEGLTVLAVQAGHVEVSVEGMCEGEVVAVAFGISAKDWSSEEKDELLEAVRLAYPMFLRDPFRVVVDSVAEAMGVSVLA